MATGIGIIGCGNISEIYLQNLKQNEHATVVGLADIDEERAKEKAAKHGIGFSGGVDQLLNRQDVEIILNLTVPKAHASVAMAAISAGKHVYNEKPLTSSWEDGLKLQEEARQRGVFIGCAPDTVLGAGIQTCRELIDAGKIGDVVSGQAFMMCPGHESWHPDPAFYYEIGGGPLFDMGPYYLSALVNLLGPVRRLCGSAKISFPTRTITSEPKNGKVVSVETPTHISSILEFCTGVMVQLTTSFDVRAHSLPHIEIYGSQGSIRVPDPNGFGGPVLLNNSETGGWKDVPLTRPYVENSRGLGVIDMAVNINQKKPIRASSDLALHVLEIMHAVHWSSERGSHIQLQTSVERPEAMPSVRL